MVVLGFGSFVICAFLCLCSVLGVCLFCSAVQAVMGGPIRPKQCAGLMQFVLFSFGIATYINKIIRILPQIMSSKTFFDKIKSVMCLQHCFRFGSRKGKQKSSFCKMILAAPLCQV